MVQEFIPYEEALELKKLKFNENCLARFDGGGFRILPAYDPLKNNEVKESWFCVTPLYQQAFRWFRDKYGIDSYVEKMIGGGSGISEVYIGVIQKLSLNTDDFSWETPSVYDTYEEAELKCLKKLIEICSKLK